MTHAGESTSTRPPEEFGINGWDKGLRIFSICFLSALVIAGLIGFLGVRATTAVASGDGFTLEVTHASVTRPGLATPLDLKVGTDDGSPLPAEVTTRIGSSYLALFDENGLDPQPVSSFQSGEWTWWTFEVPNGATILEVSFDARLEPAVQWGKGSTAAVEVGDEEVVAVDIETWVLP